jgi:hypothetical protein
MVRSETIFVLIVYFKQCSYEAIQLAGTKNIDVNCRNVQRLSLYVTQNSYAEMPRPSAAVPHNTRSPA